MTAAVASAPPRPAEALYARTTEFVALALARPDDVATIKRVVAELCGHLTGLMDFEAWLQFREALGPGAADLGDRVFAWAAKAQGDGDELAGWGYELVAINLCAAASAEAEAVAAGDLTNTIIRKAFMDASPLEYEDPPETV